MYAESCSIWQLAKMFYHMQAFLLCASSGRHGLLLVPHLERTYVLSSGPHSCETCALREDVVQSSPRTRHMRHRLIPGCRHPRIPVARLIDRTPTLDPSFRLVSFLSTLTAVLATTIKYAYYEYRRMCRA